MEVNGHTKFLYQKLSQATSGSRIIGFQLKCLGETGGDNCKNEDRTMLGAERMEDQKGAKSHKLASPS